MPTLQQQRTFSIVALLACRLLIPHTECVALNLGVAPDITDVGDSQQVKAAAGRQRSLLQNPCRPALTKNGGVNMTTMQASDYPLETYPVTTSDGWVLNLYRIPHGKNRNTGPGKKPVVYLHHGITLSSACFTLLNENESMAYILADAGFDVWMPNTRGTTFGRGNFIHSYRDFEYWQHSIDEYALLDSPAMVDKVLEVTGASKLAWVGHSQGATIGYAMLSTLPNYNDKISVIISMGPVWFMNNLRMPGLDTAAEQSTYNLLTVPHIGEVLVQPLIAPFVAQCRTGFMAEGCVAAVGSTFFGPSSFVLPDDYSVIAQTWPAGIATRNLIHYAQTIRSKQLTVRAYDHGTNCSIGHPFHETCNQLKYGSIQPPVYDLSKVSAPVVVFQGEMDIVSTSEDIEEQNRQIGRSITTIVYQAYAHTDFVWDRTARHMLDVADIAFRYSPGTF